MPAWLGSSRGPNDTRSGHPDRGWATSNAAHAASDINVRETSGNLYVDKVVSDGGDVRLQAAS